MHINFAGSRIARRFVAFATLLFSFDAGAAMNAPANPLPPVNTGTVAAVDPGSSLAPDWHKGAFMEIFVRAYKDSDGDGIGDLRGVTEKLDYLHDLGVKGIWLMPITRSQDRDHGYAVSDYRDIETDYGTLADFDALLKQAHARGIGVIIDYVVNHSAAQHPLFLNSKAAIDNPYRDWYVWQDPKPSGWNIYGHNPWHNSDHGAYFAAFSEIMPDFNLLNPAVVAYHRDNLRFWLNRGVDGFRFDAVGHLVEHGPDAWNNQPENYLLMHEMQALIKSYQRRYVVCEAPGDPLGFGAPSACGSAFAFGHSGDIINAAKGKPDAIRKVADYFKTAPAGMATMVSNHDGFGGARLWDQVGGDVAQYRLAAATYLLQPGTPFIYYGEEIGMAGAAHLGGDAALRTPMSWTADRGDAGFSSGKPFRALAANVATHNAEAQSASADSLLSFYKAMLKLRNALPSIARGSYEAAFVDASVMGFQRVLGVERTLVLINYGAAAASVGIEGLAANAKLVAAYPVSDMNAVADVKGKAEIRVDPQSVRVFLLRP